MTAGVRQAVFARIGSRPIPRVVRMMRVAADLGYDTVFCGAHRDKSLPQTEEWGGSRVVRLGRHFPLLNGRRPLLYLRSVYRFNRELYRYLEQHRPDLVHASDIETMAAALLYRRRTGARLVYNIHDNLAQRYEVPRSLAWLLNTVEGWCVRAADVTIVPEEFRRNALPASCQEQVQVVRNTPEDSGFAEPDPGSDTIRIFFGGWLDWGRGLRALMTIAEKDPGIELRVAGDGAPEIVAELEANPNVVYLGFVEHDVVMAETRQCHFVAALYDPIRTINRFAASNKLAEALSVGRPVIVNTEMEVGKCLSPADCLVVSEYKRAEELGPKLRELHSNSEAYRAACKAARQVYEAQYAWGPVRERIRQVLSGGEVLT